MKLKIAIATVAIAMSSQAYAATDTSCNPFARGASCNGVALGSAFNGSSFGQFIANHRARGPVFSRLRERSVNAGSLMSAFIASVGGSEVVTQVAQAEEAVIGDLEEVAINLAEEIAIDLDDLDEVFTDLDEVVTDLDEVAGGDEELSVVPVPAAGFLLLAGLGSLVMVRRKQS